MWTSLLLTAKCTNAPRGELSNGSAQALRGSVLPFVFRRYLDYSVFDALRVLHRQIREHAAKRCAGHPERANDVKMSRGGTRNFGSTKITSACSPSSGTRTSAWPIGHLR